MRNVLLLIGIVGLAWVVLTLPARMLGGAGSEVTGLAALLSLVPGCLTLGAAELMRSRPGMEQTIFQMAAGFIRMVFAVGVGGLVYYLEPSLQGSELALLIWGTVFYLITLAAETTLVCRRDYP